MNVHAVSSMLAAVVLAAACATTGVEQPPAAIESAPQPAPAPEPEPAQVATVPVPTPEPPPALRALQFFESLKERPARERRQAQERLRKSFAASRSDHDRMHFALALSLPGSSIAQESQALELLQPLVQDRGNDYHALALLVSAFLAEQRRRGEQAAALQTKLERIKALEKEMLERSTGRGLRAR
ncbi:MAG: hypothetical protein IT530_19275 [Burkholderiales bacterium]|nr:hypothetical protein [Burkholderiales bacterium]